MQDALCMFSIDQAVTTTAMATKAIPLDCVINAEAKQLKVNICCTEDVAGATDIQFNVGLSTSESTAPTVILGAYKGDADNLKAGTLIPMIVPIGFISEEDFKTAKYLTLQYEVTGTGTGGKFTAGIEMYPQTNH